jgi:competence protein ComFC
MGILDFIYPKFCVNCKKYGEYLCSDCFVYVSFDVANICAVCSHPSIGGETHPGCKTKYCIDGTFVGVDYNIVAKKLLYRLKYRPYVSDLTSFISDLLYESLIQKENFASLLERNKDHLVFVPIPLFPTKERRRGYNQSDLLSKALAKKFGLRSANILIRAKETKVQAGLSKKERRINMGNAFKIKNENIIKNKPPFVFLVDDILTTGATLESASNVLKRAGFEKVFGIAFAKEK